MGTVFDRLFLSCDRNNDWNVVDALIYAELDDEGLVLLASKYAITEPITEKKSL